MAHSAEREICWKNMVRSVARKSAHAVKSENSEEQKECGREERLDSCFQLGIKGVALL